MKAATPDLASARDQWLALLRSDPDLADRHYFEVLLPALLPRILARLDEPPQIDGLISLLGFSPEPAVICSRLFLPRAMVVLHTPETRSKLDSVRRYCGLAVDNLHAIEFLHDADHPQDIVRALRDALRVFPPGATLALDLTGGKKTMSSQLTVAAGLLRLATKLHFCLCFVDYDQYLPELRKPEPLSTHLLLIDDPLAASAAALGLTLSVAPIQSLPLRPEPGAG